MLRAAQKQKSVWERQVAYGCGYRFPTIWIKYRQNGRTVRESTGTTKETVARRMLRAREGDGEHGIPINPKMGRVTFEEAVKDLLNDYTINGKKTYDHTKRRIALHLTPAADGDGKPLFSTVGEHARRATSTRSSRSAWRRRRRQGKSIASSRC